jgi:hypothetical protein
MGRTIPTSDVSLDATGKPMNARWIDVDAGRAGEKVTVVGRHWESGDQLI